MRPTPQHVAALVKQAALKPRQRRDGIQGMLARSGLEGQGGGGLLREFGITFGSEMKEVRVWGG